MYIKLINNIPAQYTISQLRRDNPNVSFPDEIPNNTLVEYDVYPLYTTVRPEGDVVTEGVPIFDEETQKWQQKEKKD